MLLAVVQDQGLNRILSYLFHIKPNLISPGHVSSGKLPIQAHLYVPKGVRGVCDVTHYQGD